MIFLRYDGKEVLMNTRSIRAFNKRCNLTNSFFSPIQFNRFSKYLYLYLTYFILFLYNQNCKCIFFMYFRQRGFSTIIFEECKHVPRCDVMLSEAAFNHFERKRKKSSDRYFNYDYPDFRPPVRIR